MKQMKKRLFHVRVPPYLPAFAIMPREFGSSVHCTKHTFCSQCKKRGIFF